MTRTWPIRGSAWQAELLCVVFVYLLFVDIAQMKSTSMGFTHHSSVCLYSASGSLWIEQEREQKLIPVAMLDLFSWSLISWFSSFSQLKEYQQKNSPGPTATAKKKRKGKEGSRPETPTNDGRESPENVSGFLFHMFHCTSLSAWTQSFEVTKYCPIGQCYVCFSDLRQTELGNSIEMSIWPCGYLLKRLSKDASELAFGWKSSFWLAGCMQLNSFDLCGACFTFSALRI